MRQKKYQTDQELDPNWIKELTEALKNIQIYSLSDNHKKKLKDLYFENIKAGLQPKEAINKAMDVFKSLKS